MLHLDQSSNSEIQDPALPWPISGPTPSVSPKPPSLIVVDTISSSTPYKSHPEKDQTQQQQPQQPHEHDAPSSDPAPTTATATTAAGTPEDPTDDAASHLTPLTDVPDEDDQNTQEPSRSEQGGGGDVAEEVDEGYQSGGPSPGTTENVDKTTSNLTPPPALSSPLTTIHSSPAETSDVPEKPRTVSKSETTPIVVEPESKPSDPVPATSSNPSPAGSTKDPPLPPPASTSAVPSPAHAPSPSRPLTHGSPSSNAAPSSPSHLHLSEQNPKVSLLLEVNAELIRLYMDFQSRSLHQTPDCQAYSSRLQSNLTWLAASADKSRPENNSWQVPLPNMEPPPAIGFADTTQLRQLYEKLPRVFAKEIARRQRLQLKRERTPEDVGNVARKRQDLGDSKLSSGAPTLPLHASMPNGISPTLHPNVPNSTMNPGQGTGTAQPTMQLQNSVPPSQMTPRIAQSGSSSDLQRQMQIRQLTQHRQQSHASPPPPQLRHTPAMSPTEPPSLIVNMAAQPPPQAVQQMHPAMNPMNPSMNPAMNMAANPSHMATVQALQDPNNRMVKFMLSKDPNFLSRPLNQQLQAIQAFQNAARRQVQLLQSPQMNRMPGQPPGAPMQNTMVGANQFRPGTSLGNHPQASNPLQQMPHPLSNSSTMQPNGMPYNPGMQAPQQQTNLSRPGSSHLALGGPNMTAQQRQQLMLMQQQQQQQMRGLNPAQASSPPSFNGQQPSPQAHQQFHHSPTHSQSPSFIEGGDGMQNPSQSGSTVPGIARSTRSPSEPLGTPTKRHMSFSNDPYHQTLMNSTGQQQQQPAQLPQYTLQQHLQQQQQQQQQQMMQRQQMQGAPPMNWPTGFNNTGMNPAAFQLNQNPQQLYINPNALGGPNPMPQGPNMAQQHWPQSNAQFNHASSPTPSMHHSEPASSSRHASATPAPQQIGADANTNPHFDPSMYNWT